MQVYIADLHSLVHHCLLRTRSQHIAMENTATNSTSNTAIVDGSSIEESRHGKEWKEFTDRVKRYMLEIRDEADDYYQSDAYYALYEKYYQIRDVYYELPSVDSEKYACSKQTLRDLIKKLKANQQWRIRDFLHLMETEDKAIIEAAEKLLCKL